jgi:hypothetical protein
VSGEGKNLLTRLPEATVIAGLAALCGYLMHEAGTEAAMIARIEMLEIHMQELQGFHPREK